MVTQNPASPDGELVSDEMIRAAGKYSRIDRDGQFIPMKAIPEMYRAMRRAAIASPRPDADAKLADEVVYAPRFFVDHGMVHDRETGKHVCTDDSMVPFEDGAVAACALLNSLDSHARHHWRCFFCDEVFTTVEAAREHFGASEAEEPGCKLNALEGGLLKLYREALAELRAYRDEDHPTIRTFYALGAEHHQKVQRAEEEGYAKGLKDAAVHCTPELVAKLVEDAMATCEPEEADATASAHTRVTLTRRFTATITGENK